ncbi:MAG: hypothetical protein HC800_18630 [Phormidesmis sp. RL_2_1]|nr:hypothetical protein [Phormidesmis sp. RL_2_1]
MKKSLTRNIVSHLLGTAATVVLLGGALTIPASALTRIEIDDITAATSISTLEVPRGHSVVLTLDNGQYIQAIWIDDPSLLGIATDRPLCADGTSTSSQNCGSASVVRLMSLGGSIDLPGTSFGQGNGTATVMTLITTDAGGTNRKTYQFTINAITGRSDISHVVITPTLGSDYAQSRVDVQAFRDIRSFDIDAVRVGREIVLANGRANTSSVAWQNLEHFLALLDQNQDVESAAADSGVNRALLVELEHKGLSSVELSAT